MCGLIGIVARNPVVLEIYEGLTVLQHRGQDAAGMAVSDSDGKLRLYKNNGLVRDVFHAKHIERMGAGMAGIGHVRYPTAGCDSSDEAQPLYVNSPFGLALAHNGNLTNTRQLKREVFLADRRHINTDSDSEVLLNVLAHELQVQSCLDLKPEHFFTAVKEVHRRCAGGYATIGLIPGSGIFGFRDPHGIRPLVYGVRRGEEGDEWALASESVALDVLGFELVADVPPGAAVFIDMDGKLVTEQCAEPQAHTPCIFEFVYFARPDSMLDDISVYKARLRMGEKLAQKILREWPDHDIDVVVPVPDTSRTAAIPLAHDLGVKHREGLIKNRYIGRTFIMPGQGERKRSVRRKLNPVGLEFKDKNVLLIDDSIVRGTTSKELIQMAREAGARKVYLASAAPPVRYPNVYGIDMPSATELIGHGRSVEQIQEELGCDRLIYQDLEDLIAACREGNPHIATFDTSCFSGDYITAVTDSYLRDLEIIRSDQAKAERASHESA